MRLDHLLSKEPLGYRGIGHPCRDPEDSRSVHWLLGWRAGSLALVPFPEGERDRCDEPAGHTVQLWVRASEHLENSIASASIYSQVRRAYGGCSRRQEPMKDASGCEKPRGAAEKA